jgi:hypothetical protein
MYVIQKQCLIHLNIKILNTYNFFHINHNIEFMEFLYKLMKNKFHTKLLHMYEA